MVTVSFEVMGTSQVERTILGWSDRAQDLRPAFEVLHSMFLEIERKQFDTEGASGSGGWDALKAKTVSRKLAKGQDPRILRATNTLFRSLTEPVFGQHVAKISPSEAFFGTSVPYARVHQTGAPKANIPKRQPVELTESQRKEWVKTIQVFLRANDR